MNYDATIWQIICLSLMQLVEGKRTDRQSTKRIVNGQLANIEDFPHMVSLWYKTEPVCGGSIVSPKWVLTGAHCIIHTTTPDKTKFVVYVGSHIQGKGEKYNVIDAIEDKLYDDMYLYADVALLKIKGQFKFGKTVSSIKLAMKDKTPDASLGDNCVTAGWGLNQVKGVVKEHEDLLLRSVRMKVVEPSVCDKEWAYLFSSQMCALGSVTASGTCSGDSGSALVCDGIQVGVLSFGTDDCVPSMSEVYTRVASYYSWIMETVEADGPARGHRKTKVVKPKIRKSIALSLSKKKSSKNS